MNNPEYILTDEIETVVTAVKTSLNLPVLNYQYGYVSDVAEKLQNYGKTATYAALKFPLVWLVQPFTVKHDGTLGIFGKVDDLEIFVINETKKNADTATRMATNFKPIIYPIVRELKKQLCKSGVFAETSVEKLIYRESDWHYWGETQNKAITDVFDCTRIFGLNLTIKNNKNCP